MQGPRRAIEALWVVVCLAACVPALPSGPSASGAPTSPSPLAAGLGAWAPIGLPDREAGILVNGVNADASGFLVLGSVNGRSAVWTSADAATWSADALGPGESAREAAVAPTMTIVVGLGGTSLCAHPFGEFVWRRLAGSANWEAAPFVESEFCMGGIPRIATGNGTTVIAGSSQGDSPFAWVSGDGLAWTDESRQLAADSAPSILAWTGSRYVILVRGEVTRAYASSDGRRWSALPPPPVPPAFAANANGMSPAALLSTKAGTFAVYGSEDASVLIELRLGDDNSWTDVRPSGLPPGAAVTGGAVVEGRLYLFSSVPGAAGVWASDDGATWRAIQVPPADEIVGLATFQGRAVLVETRNDPNLGTVPLVYAAATAVIR